MGTVLAMRERLFSIRESLSRACSRHRRASTVRVFVHFLRLVLAESTTVGGITLMVQNKTTVFALRPPICTHAPATEKRCYR